jgi:hypothetical protein
MFGTFICTMSWAVPTRCGVVVSDTAITARTGVVGVLRDTSLADCSGKVLDRRTVDDSFDDLVDKSSCEFGLY